MFTISSSFDGGNINVIEASNANAIRLAIAKDHQSDFYQWFYFRLAGAAQTPCRMMIENAGGSSYTPGWNEYQTVASYDRETWFRVPTSYQDGVLTIDHTPDTDLVWYAYFAPYSMERHHDLIAEIACCDGVHAEVAGFTLDGQTMDVLHIGEPDSAKRQIWVTARQHPGETMAEWWIEGFLSRLTDRHDPVARTLRHKAVVHIVPNMNPDGSRRGHLRTNAAGINLNREWDKASLEKSPEVFHILTQMDKTGVDLAFDVHGDENLPYNFIAGAEGTPGFDDHAAQLLHDFKHALTIASPDFQTKVGYPVSKPGTADLSICTNALAHRYKCLAMTLEMPFKDTVETPDPIQGWSPERCIRLGAAGLDAMLSVVDTLR